VRMNPYEDHESVAEAFGVELFLLPALPAR
jgi:hypothetical protein